MALITQGKLNLGYFKGQGQTWSHDLITIFFCFFTVVLRKLEHIYRHSVFTSKIQWSCIRPEAGSHVTERYSHCCCYYDKSLYMFGGCTATNTTLNDLWRFDLATREWIRPLAMGEIFMPQVNHMKLILNIYLFI